MRFDRANEERFLNKPVILEVAGLIANYAKRAYSDRHYEGRDTSLRVLWQATEAFRAGAFVAANGDHEIRLSYGTAIEIYRDAFVLPQTCQRILGEAAFDPIFKLVSYGNARADVLPAGLTPTDAKVTIIRMMTIWLYLHEQAHLHQRHGDVAESRGLKGLFSNAGEIVDAVSDEEGATEDRDAPVRHAFELAADYEATTNLMMGEAAGGMTEADLWCFTAGLMCMFYRFYGMSPTMIEAAPRGTHPHPAVRMRMAMNKVERLFAVPDFAKAAGWTRGPTHARAIMDHAVYATDVYWHLRYLGLDARPEYFDTLVTPRAIPPGYQQSIFSTWRDLRSDIVKGHLGHGEAVVMFLRDPSAVG